LLVDATRRNNYDPHPARLRFASAVDPPHKGEGRLGREPSCKATECVTRAASTSTGQALEIVAVSRARGADIHTGRCRASGPPRCDALRYHGEEQEHCEDDEVYDALKHRGPARAQRDHADEKRQRQQDLVLLAQPELERLGEHD
jgi:hypothetical protein